MSKSMNPKMSGFRKWAEIREPTKIDKARTGANEGGVIAAAVVDQEDTGSNNRTSMACSRSIARVIVGSLLA